MNRNPGFEKVKGESAGSLLRLFGLLVLGTVLLFGTLFLIFISTCPINLLDRAILRHPDISGSIFVHRLYYYSPSCGCEGSHDFPYQNQQPEILCEIEGDTLILCSYEPLDTNLTQAQVTKMRNDTISYFYKYKPFTNSFCRIAELTDRHSLTYYLDYDIERKQFVRWNPGDNRLLLLNRDFDLVRDLTPFLKRSKIEYNVWGVQFVRNGLAIQYRDTLKLYNLESDSLIATDRAVSCNELNAVSHSGNLVIYSQRGQDNAIPYLLDIATGAVKKLQFKQEFLSVCFSPNDSLVAYSRVTNNLTDDVTMFIYDLYSGEQRKTGVQNAVGLNAWIRSEPPAAGSLSQSGQSK